MYLILNIFNLLEQHTFLITNHQIILIFIDNFGPEKKKRSATRYMTSINDETIEDISALEQYLKDYDNKNSCSFTGNTLL